MLSNYMFDKIRKLINAGKNNSEIARELRINRKTVRSYRLSNMPPRYTERRVSTRIDPFADYEREVITLLDNAASKSCKLTAGEVFVYLKQKGYKGSERTVERRLQRLRPLPTKERFFEQEYSPGEQSQVDFKEKIALPFVDGERIVYIFFGTLPYSDKVTAKAFPSKTFEAFADGCHSFFERIGGVPQNLRIDNLSPAVIKVLRGHERIYTRSFQKMIGHYGFGVLPCNPGKGSEKGDVERDIQTHIKHLKNFIALENKVFENFDDVNHWIDEKIDLFTKCKPARYEEEMKVLRPLPLRDESVLGEVFETRSNKYGVFTIDKSRYSVPDQYILELCRVVVDAYCVKIFLAANPGQIVAIHPRMKPGKDSILLEHAVESLMRKPAAMIRWSHRDILFPHPEFKKYYEYLKIKLPHAPESHFLKTLNLIHNNVTLEELSVAVEIVMESGSNAPFADVQMLLVEGGHHPPESFISQQVRIEPDLQQYNQLIPNNEEKNAS